jgi:hypothetical protein
MFLCPLCLATLGEMSSNLTYLIVVAYYTLAKIHWFCAWAKAMEEPSAWEYEGDGEDMDALVSVGDNFVVPA